MKARPSARGPLERRSQVMTLVGFAAMLGFIATLVLFLLGWLAERGFWLGVVTSLATFGAALLLGHRGEPADAPAPARTSLQRLG
jgi:hypothetical protein